MPSESPRYRIIVALDLGEYSPCVLEHALDLAARHDAPDLHFVTVVSRDTEIDPAKERLAAAVLEALDAFHRLGSNWRARMHVRAGRADEEIVGLAAELRAHLIVMGRFGVHDRGKKLGTIATKVLQAATCPTLIVTITDYAEEVDACEACVAVRAETDGERWFCEAHAGDRLVSSSMSTPWTGGTLMW